MLVRRAPHCCARPARERGPPTPRRPLARQPRHASASARASAARALSAQQAPAPAAVDAPGPHEPSLQDLLLRAAAANAPAAAPGDAPPSLQQLLAAGPRLTTITQAVWAQVLRPGDTAVDATCGNGHDTLALARAVGPSGRVLAFDIQESAIAATRERLHSQLPPGARPALTLLRACHSGLAAAAGPGVARLVVFNLGYLPKGDSGVITAAASTLAALRAAQQVVMPGGLITILSYTGHPGGVEEYEAVRQLMAELSPSDWEVSETRRSHGGASAAKPGSSSEPILLMLKRKGGGSS